MTCALTVRSFWPSLAAGAAGSITTLLGAFTMLFIDGNTVHHRRLNPSNYHRCYRHWEHWEPG